MSTDTALAPIVAHGKEYADRGYCYSPYRGDGPVIHTAYCRHDPRDTAVSSSDCIRYGQDGAAIRAAREAKADRLRFTPPEYRGGTSVPGPAIGLVREQKARVVALRGRPRTPDGTGEWTTWETFTQVDPAYKGGYLFEWKHKIPSLMGPEEAAAIVAEFTARVPHYEFKMVRARLVLDEEQIA